MTDSSNAAPATTRPATYDARKVGAFIKSLTGAAAKNKPNLLTADGFAKAHEMYAEHVAKHPEAAPAAEPGEPSTTHIGLWDPTKGTVVEIQSAPTSGRGSTPEKGSELDLLLQRMRAAAEATGLQMVQVKLRG